MHAATSTPLADRVRLMAHPSVIRAFTAPNSVRLFQNNPPHGLLRRTCISGRQSFRHVAACMLVRAAGPSLPVLAPPTGPPVYGRACPNRGLPRPGSAMATRPNHPLPRQDLHLQACQRPKAAPRSGMLSHVKASPPTEDPSLHHSALRSGPYSKLSGPTSGFTTNSTHRLRCTANVKSAVFASRGIFR